MATKEEDLDQGRGEVAVAFIDDANVEEVDLENGKKPEDGEWFSGNGNLQEVRVVERDHDLLHEKREVKAIKEKALSFTKAVTLVGLSHAVDASSSRVRRVIWTLWLLFGLGLAVFQIQERIAEYRRYPFDTQIEIKQVSEIQFPQVTICRQHNINKSKAEELGVLEFMENFDTGDDWETSNKSISEDLKAMNWAMVLKNISYPWKDHTFWGKNNELKSEEVKTDLGYCIAYGSENEELTSTEAGLAAGLNIILEDFESSFAPPIPTLQDLQSGYRVLIHDPLEEPLLSDAGFFVPFGTASQIQITLENITQLAKPYGDCNDDPDYKYSTCVSDFWKKDLLHSHNCTLLYTNDVGDKGVCNYEIHEDMRLYKEFFSYIEISGKACPQQCLRKLYTYSLTQTKFSRAVLEKLKKNKLIDENITTICIYYPLMMYYDIESVPSYTIFALLSDIGGALSLLLGATLLTVYEMGEFAFLISRDYIRYRFASSVSTA